VTASEPPAPREARRGYPVGLIAAAAVWAAWTGLLVWLAFFA